MLTRLLIAASHPSVEKRYERILKNEYIIVDSGIGSAHLWESVSRETYDFILLSRSIIGAKNSDSMRFIRSLPHPPNIIVLSEEEDPQDRAELLAAGCLSVLYDGLSDSLLRETLSSILQRKTGAVEEVPAHDRFFRRQPQLSDFILESPAMGAFMNVVHRVVASDATLLIMGETGVGKERLARAIHAESPRSTGPFISVNCGALSEALLESELFGHEEGAFTGASRARRGWFELAHNGTIFLDEIGEMPKHLQVKLLTVLQTREVQRVGSELSVPIDVRIMAATNRDLEQEVAAREFRRDLYYRLSVVSLTIPPLRERREDVPHLAKSLIQHFRSELPYEINGLTNQATEALIKYDWPGNVRELMNVLERAMLLASGDTITSADLPQTISGSAIERTPELPSPKAMRNEQLRIPNDWLQKSLGDARKLLLQEFEKAYLTGLLEKTKGKIGETARLAGIRPRSLYEKMKRLGLSKDEFRTKRRKST